MNRLNPERQAQALTMLTEGCSIRATERMTGVHRDTLCRLALRVGEACDRLHDETMRKLPCTRIEMDELWSFVAKKQARLTKQDDSYAMGDAWCWVALDPDSKAVPAYSVGKRTADVAELFVCDLASRLANRVQLSSDALFLYREAVDKAFGPGVDYAQIVKAYESVPVGPGRYAPPKVASVSKTALVGSPEMHKATTSHCERLNLTIRTNLRRYTRLSLGFSKTFDGLRAASSLFFTTYNFTRRHGSLRITPAMALGVTNRLWTMADIVDYAAQAGGSAGGAAR